jgi:hypothetical protein
LRESFAYFDLDSSCWRTSQATFLWDSDEYSETWPDSGSMRNGIVYERAISEPAISENECSSWPTARQEDGESCGNHPGAIDSLTGAVKMWPTPCEDNANNAGGPSRSRSNAPYRDLTVDAIHWTTPQAHDAVGPKTPDQIAAMRAKNGSGVRNLNEDAALWQTPHGMSNKDFRGKTGGCGGGEFAHQANHWETPTSRDWKSETGSENNSYDKTPNLSRQVYRLPQDQQTPDGQQSSSNTHGLRRRLNPAFVEWLLAFPVGWSAL